MAKTKINSLVDRIVRILKKNDSLSGLFFKDLGQIHIVNIDSNDLETIEYDPSDIEDFFDAYDKAIERRLTLELKRK